MEASILIWIGAAILAAVGLAGLVLPIVPGAPVMFAGLVLAAWADDFAYVGGGTLTVLGSLALLTYAVDFAATAFGAKRFGASSRACRGADDRGHPRPGAAAPSVRPDSPPAPSRSGKQLSVDRPAQRRGSQ